jgi:hypothetical protein
MNGNKHMEWTALWKWFGAIDTRRPVSRENWKGLYHILNKMWQGERKDATIEELAAHANAVVGLLQNGRSNRIRHTRFSSGARIQR